MSNISMSDAELLKFAIDNGMIDTALVQEKIEMQKRKELLEKHPYSIWEDKNGIWHTYLPDKKRGRVPRKRTCRKKIENVVIDYWREQAENPTIEDVFKEWVGLKCKREEISKSTKDRYNRQYEQCFSDFGKRKIKSVSEYDVENFILDSINRYKLTQKGFSNMRTLIFGIFKLAKKKHLVMYSITEVINDIDISRKSFRREVKEDSQQVFMLDEKDSVIEYLENNQDVLNLGILLLFKTGLRIGELCALKKADISNNVIHISRTEICYEDEAGRRVFEVRDFPKTEAGIRDVVIPTKDAWILKAIRSKCPFGEFLFMEKGDRIRTYVFRNRLNTVCKNANVIRKSPHKIRKTYGSILLDNGVAESIITSQMGHTDIRTTKEHYYRNRRNAAEKSEIIDTVSGL